MADCYDEAMRKLKQHFHARVGKWGSYHFACGQELMRRKRAADAERREALRKRRSEAAKRRAPPKIGWLREQA